MSDLPLPLGLAELQREMALRQGLPPVERWHPAFCGDSSMRIARDGTWFHRGSPIGRRELVRLFSTILRKDGQDYFLVTPSEKLSIAVDDVPFLAVLLTVEGAGRHQRLFLTTNVGDMVCAGADHAICIQGEHLDSGPLPYLHVRRGLLARISRPVFYQLADLAVPGTGEDLGSLGVWSDGIFFPLGPLP